MLLKDFEPIFRKDIAPIYVHNQKEFDEGGIHGVLHIARSLLICRILHHALSQRGYVTDINKISFAVAFHDSGRRANGIDYWESNSKEICLRYLWDFYNPYIPQSEFEYTANLILKGDLAKKDYNFMCVYDTDVLEIVRPCTGIGAYNFNRMYLRLNYLLLDCYTPIINETISFILQTEENKHLYSDENALSKLMELLQSRQTEFPLLYNASIS